MLSYNSIRKEKKRRRGEERKERGRGDGEGRGERGGEIHGENCQLLVSDSEVPSHIEDQKILRIPRFGSPYI